MREARYVTTVVPPINGRSYDSNTVAALKCKLNQETMINHGTLFFGEERGAGGDGLGKNSRVYIISVGNQGKMLYLDTVYIKRNHRSYICDLATEFLFNCQYSADFG